MRQQQQLFWQRAVRLAAFVGVVASTLVMNSGSSLRAQAPASTDVVCFPTCTVNDGRFLVVAGNDPTTLGGVAVDVRLGAPLTAASITFGIFDGDRTATTTTNWDIPRLSTQAPPLRLDLYADPDGLGPDAPGTTAVLVQSWTEADVAFPNNDWLDLQIANHPLAQTSDRYRYLLRISAVNPTTNLGWNSFKVRTTGSLALAPKAFAFLAAFTLTSVSNVDANIIYPNFPNMALPLADRLNPTTYDGSWQFAFALTSPAASLSVWDGDMDFGSRDCVQRDSDDPDSPAFPPFLHPNAAAEGIAVGSTVGTCITTSNPNEDNASIFLQRFPNRLGTRGILYDIVDPLGNSYANLNPSGNTEWERFKVTVAADVNPLQPCLASSDPDRPNTDCKAAAINPGVYRVLLDGVDLNNLNFWQFDYPALGSTPSGTPVEEGAFYSIGRLVWYDTDGDGVRDAGEPGINGVTVRVIDQNGIEQTGATTGDGEFVFRKPAGSYTVTVDASNFGAGRPLVGLHSTTGGNVEGGLNVGVAPLPPYAEAVFGYAANTPPTAEPDAVVLACGSTMTIGVLANDTDNEANTLTVTAVSPASHGTAILNADGTITYTPAAGYVGADSFSYTISDGAGGSASTAVSVTVANQNPIAVNDAAGTAYNTPVTVTVLANDSDPDGGLVSVLSVTNGAHGSAAVNADGTITYVPADGFSGTDSFTYTIGEGCGMASATVTITVAPRPAPPAVCYVGTKNASVTAVQSWLSNPDGSVTIRTTLGKSFLDNTYGANAIGWPGGGGNGNHKFDHLVTSDMIQLALYNAGGSRTLEFKLDYFSAASNSSTGYASLGTWGGDGAMVFGSGSMIESADSSLATNFRVDPSYILTVNSPATDAAFTPNPTYPKWIFDAWYEVTVKPEAFGAAGFGYPRITAIHASPSKTGVETEPLRITDCAGVTIPFPNQGGGTLNGTGGKVTGRKK